MNHMGNFFLFFLIFTLALPGSDASSWLSRRFLILDGIGPMKMEPPEGSPWPDRVSVPSPSPNALTSQQQLNRVTPLVAPAFVESPKAELDDDCLIDDKCKMSSDQCQDQKSMIACVVHPATAQQQELCLLVQNAGDSKLKVNITGSLINMDAVIPKYKVIKIKFLSFTTKSGLVVLNAGSGACVIRIHGSLSVSDATKRFRSYGNRVNTINGGYVLFVLAVVIGGTWLWCMCQRRGQYGDGIPYQELEMGQPESLQADNVVTAEDWDQGWDDEWDNRNAAKPSDNNHSGNITTNRKTSKSSNRNGWENEWDD